MFPPPSHMPAPPIRNNSGERSGQYFYSVECYYAVCSNPKCKHKQIIDRETAKNCIVRPCKICGNPIYEIECEHRFESPVMNGDGSICDSDAELEKEIRMIRQGHLPPLNVPPSGSGLRIQNPMKRVHTMPVPTIPSEGKRQTKKDERQTYAIAMAAIIASVVNAIMIWVDICLR